MDTYLLGKYLQLIVASFVVCLSVLLMQYTFRYMEELIGKGLETTVILKFFAYASLTMVPMALPLSLLLASLITYGNLGESRELLAMKAAGIPLLRVFRPVFLFVALLSAGSFVFQNSVMPYAVKELAALVWSMKQKNPELDIPEGQFYNAIPGYNLYVENKNPETGMLHEVMIYANPSSPDDAQIVLADSARLQTTADKRHLKLTLFQGERFKNFDSQTGNMLRAESPYMRETFMHEEMLINFDANFDVMSSSQFSHNAQTKPLKEISLGIDSLHARIDSLGRSIYYMQLRGTMRRESNLIGEDSAKLVASLKDAPSLDKAWEELSREDKAAALGRMQNAVAQSQNEYEFRSLMTEEDNRALRVHRMEWYKKFTMSAACIIFFFIGAPLGSIVRKGGLGVSVLLSTIIFIFYYIINVSGEKMGKSGQWNPIFGVWFSSMVLAPLAAYLTIKSNRDSAVFNVDTYVNFFRQLFGISPHRKLNVKDIVLNDPDYPAIINRLDTLSQHCDAYIRRKRLTRLPNYIKIFFFYHPETALRQIEEELESVVEELHNSRDHHIIKLLCDMPILWPESFARPFSSPWANRLIGILLPIGILFWLRMWQYRLRMKRDLNETIRINTKISDIIKRTQL